ncbi:MAG: formylglycine-generating enzyme family protein [Thermoguttaceae bacterium]|jgi:formylglycine-generating enzyme required for sulfatase activity
MKTFLAIKPALVAAVCMTTLFFASCRSTAAPVQGVGPGEVEGDRLVLTINGIPFPFRWAPAGKFLMGSSEGEEGRDAGAEIRHQVELTKGFWILETEVTQEMYTVVTKVNPSHFKGENLPVDTVSWNDAFAFCDAWSAVVRLPRNLTARLPSEAEWEYACRAGTLGPYYTNIDSAGWIGEKTESGSTHPVGEKEPNDWGLYDMHGNLWEWTADSWYDYTQDKATDPRGPQEGSVKVDRGGCWDSKPEEARSAYRGVYEAERSSRFVGFRFVIIEE